MSKYRTLVLVFLALCMSCTAAAGSVTSQVPTTSPAPWLDEHDFSAIKSLYATRGQTVLLHLKSFERGKSAMRRHAVRFLVRRARAFSFCIPHDDPYLVRVRLKSAKGATLMTQVRGRPCRPVTLAPGLYKLDIYHDARRIASGSSRLAFLYQVRTSSGALGSQAQPSAPPWNFMAFRGENGKFVTDNTGYPNIDPLGTYSTTVGPREVWRVNPSSNGTDFQLRNGSSGNSTSVCQNVSPPEPLFTQVTNGESIACYPVENTVVPVNFNMFRTGITLQFSASFPQANGTYKSGNVITAQGFLELDPGQEPATFTLDYEGYDCDTACNDTTLPLDPGQIALYTQCNYQGPAIVFSADKADLSIYSQAAAANLGIGADQARSIRVGPNTIVDLYPSVNYTGERLTTAANIPCLDTTSLGNDVLESFKVQQNVVHYINSSNGCPNCYLNGVDLSGQWLTLYDFSGTVFSGADLSDTTFQTNNLRGASFAGASTNLDTTAFYDSDLSCTSFFSANITNANFTSAGLAQDYSCFLDLEEATVNFAQFPTDDWRFINLTRSTMNHVPDPLSTADAPLDLSGANLSGVGWLAGKTLDRVNLGCYPGETGSQTSCPAPQGTAHCSTLQGTVLNRTSLKGACLSNASMEGAFLDYSNLDGADMSGVQLQAQTGGKVGTLDGAFMRNTNLTGANLTGVDAESVNFFTAPGGTAEANDVTAPGANFSNSYLAFADFSGPQSDLQSTIWTNAMLLGANFSQVDLTTNTSGGVNSGTNTTFEGAYLQGAQFDSAQLADVNFLNTYWDAYGAGGSLNLLIPKKNLNFTGYWKVTDVPECPRTLKWDSGYGPPAYVTDASNTCPNGDPGPCDNYWDQPTTPISQAIYQSAVPPYFPQDPTATADYQCGTSENSEDLCWTTTNPNPGQCIPQTQ